MFSVTTETVEVSVSVFRCIKFLLTPGKGKTRLGAHMWPANLKVVGVGGGVVFLKTVETSSLLKIISKH